jgi:hypothetical protein
LPRAECATAAAMRQQLLLAVMWLLLSPACAKLAAPVVTSASAPGDAAPADGDGDGDGDRVPPRSATTGGVREVGGRGAAWLPRVVVSVLVGLLVVLLLVGLGGRWAAERRRRKGGDDGDGKRASPGTADAAAAATTAAL